MAPSSCFVDPMDCILVKRSPAPVLHKRAPPETAPQPGHESKSNSTVIVAVSVSMVLLILCLALFYYCVRKRRASRRIGQLQRFLPTFMDQEKTEIYFQKQGSSSTLVSPGGPSKDLAPPSNVHHRTRSAPIAFAKGVTDHRNRQLERDGSLGQFQQISLVSEETILEKDAPDPKRSLSAKSARNRSVSNANPSHVKSTLHRSISLNKHGQQGTTNSRSDLAVDEEDADQQSKFADGESLVAPNRFSALLDFGHTIDTENNRFSATSIVGVDPDFDPTRFSSASVIFDAKRVSSSRVSSDSEASSSSDEFRNNIPPHQQQPSFHNHHNSPIERSREATAMYFGDKQELDEDEDEIQPPPRQPSQPVQGYAGLQNYPRPQFYPPLQSNMPMPMPMPMPVPMPVPMPAPPASLPRGPSPTPHAQLSRGPSPTPYPADLSISTDNSGMPRRPGMPLPPNIRLSRPHGGQEMSLATDDHEVDDEEHH